jgi:DNA-binding PadR family transcriptional regulator
MADWWDAWKGFAAAFGGRPGRFFEPGEVRLALLSLLEQGPKHGYELMKSLETRSGGLYRASAGAIYPTLQQMEDEGLVVSDALEGGKRVYRIADAGRAELDKDRERVERIWARAGHWREMGSWTDGVEMGLIGMLAGELMGEAMRAAKRVAGRPGGLEGVRTVLERTRQDLRRLADEADPTASGPGGAGGPPEWA